MSKYDPLWEYVASQTKPSVKMTFDEIAWFAGVEMDHSFLTYKKELLAYGWKVSKISLKAQTVLFEKGSLPETRL